MSADSFYDIDSPAFPYKWKKGVNMNIRTLEHNKILTQNVSI